MKQSSHEVTMVIGCRPRGEAGRAVGGQNPLQKPDANDTAAELEYSPAAFPLARWHLD